MLPVIFVSMANLKPTSADVKTSIAEFATVPATLLSPSKKFLTGPTMCQKPNKADAINAESINIKRGKKERRKEKNEIFKNQEKYQ